MAMLLPIMVGLQTAVSVSELERGEVSFQLAGGRTLRDWQTQLELKSTASLASAGEGAEIVKGYVVRAYGAGRQDATQGFCLVPKNSDEKCLAEY